MNSIKKINRNNFTYKRLKIEFSKFLIDKGIIKGQNDYQKFIILGRSRVGSNLLISYLNSHPNIFANGEFFGNCVSGNILKYRWNNPNDYLHNYCFKNYNKNIKAVGFKIFYYHPVKGEPKTIWSLLGDMKDLKVIHLKRNNILRTHLSKEIASKTDKWIKTGSNDIAIDEKATKLSKEECLKVFEETTKWQKDFDELFKDHQKIDIYYENILNDNRNELKRVQQFLDLKVYDLKTALIKQNPEPLNKLIANYSELKQQFAGTQWAGFFED
jgi:LPS sulfotransferase NodH